MKTVTTKKELEQAIKNGEKKVLCKGALGLDMKRKYEKLESRKRKTKVLGGMTLLAGLLAAPFTGGMSAVGALGAMGITAGSLVLTTGELALLLGAALVAYGVSKDKRVAVKKTYNGEVMLCIE